MPKFNSNKCFTLVPGLVEIAVIVGSGLVASGCATLSEAAMVAMMSPLIVANAATAPIVGGVYIVKGMPGSHGIQEIAMSPDGARLAVRRREDKFVHLTLIDTATRTVSVIEDAAGDQRDLAFNDDGTLLAVALDNKLPGRDGRFHLILYRLGSHASQVIATESEAIVSPAFSPSGGRIAYVTAGSIVVVELDDGFRTVLTATEVPDAFPKFVDEQRIVFMRPKYYGHASPIAASAWHDYRFHMAVVGEPEATQLPAEEFYTLPNFVRIARLTYATRLETDFTMVNVISLPGVERFAAASGTRFWHLEKVNSHEAYAMKTCSPTISSTVQLANFFGDSAFRAEQLCASPGGTLAAFRVTEQISSQWPTFELCLLDTSSGEISRFTQEKFDITETD